MGTVDANEHVSDAHRAWLRAKGLQGNLAHKKHLPVHSRSRPLRLGIQGCLLIRNSPSPLGPP